MQVRGKGADKQLVLTFAVHHRALGGDPGSEGNPHSTLLVRAEPCVHRVRIIAGAATAVNINHAGYPGSQLPGRAHQRIEICVARAHTQKGEDPRLQEQVENTMLNGGGSVAVMMGIHKTGHDRHFVRAEMNRIRIRLHQFRFVSHRDDSVRLDHYRRIAV